MRACVCAHACTNMFFSLCLNDSGFLPVCVRESARVRACMYVCVCTHVFAYVFVSLRLNSAGNILVCANSRAACRYATFDHICRGKYIYPTALNCSRHATNK